MFTPFLFRPSSQPSFPVVYDEPEWLSTEQVMQVVCLNFLLFHNLALYKFKYISKINVYKLPFLLNLPRKI